MSQDKILKARQYFHKAYELGIKRKKYHDAIRYLDKAIALDPESAIAYFYRGDFYFYSKQYEKALIDIKYTNKMFPKNPDVYATDYWMMGECYLGIEDYVNAIASFDKSISYDYIPELSYIGRGRVYLKTGKLESAISDFNKAVESNPKELKAYLYRADYFMAIGKNENAISDLNMVINSTKDDDLKKKATSKLASIIK